VAKIQDIDIPYLEFAEAAAPGTPASAISRIYVKSDGLFYSKDDAGVETLMSSGSGSGIPATIFDAKGDLIAASAADTAARLAAGSNGTILMAASGEATGLKWVALQSDKVKRTAGDLTYTSATFTDVTGMSITFTTGARRCLVSVVATTKHSSNTFGVALDINIDGTRQGTTTWGLIKAQASGNGYESPLAFTYLTDVLSAASHTFKLQAATDGATGTVYASDPPLIMSVHEIL
jgi:hypothetical protein